jgi:hypothetical protein
MSSRETIYGEDGPVLPHGGIRPGSPFVAIQEYNVGQWFPTPDGSGKPTAVQVSFDGLAVMPDGDKLEAQMYMRIKSAVAVDDLIRALLRSRKVVWPNEPVNIY